MTGFQLRTLKQLDDTEGTVRLHDARGRSHEFGDHDLVLFPPVSQDPNDPLRWPAWRKWVAFGSMCVLAFLSNAAVAGVYPAFVEISVEFATPYAQVTELSSYLVLIIGCSNFVWVPLAVYYGKRPIFLVSSALLVASTAWAARATSFESLLAASALTGVAAGSTEAIGAAIVNDIYFLHQRATKMSIGWRWVKGIISILSGVNFVMILFLVPESRFKRDLTQVEDVNAVQPRESIIDGEDPAEKESTLANEFELAPIPTNSSTIPSKMSQMQLLAFCSGVPKDMNLLELFLRPFPLIAYPAVLWATLAYAVALATSVMSSVVNPAVLQAPPYNFSSGTNGLINIPSLIGNLVGGFLGGWCTDWVADKWSIRNQGIFNPEVRLSMITIPLILTTIGMALFGAGLEEKWSWPGLFVSFGLISVTLTATSSICMTYVLDAYYPAAAEALLLVNALKNIIAFGFIYAVSPWVSKVGFKAALGEMAAIFFGITALGYVLMAFGKPIRHYTSTKWRIILW
ncbi:hypothetical protein CLAIMM_13833 [Cladophialophora immunda]|nr:hypothetical protein CLAIMM_13833 [Cladophialophora immunda]